MLLSMHGATLIPHVFNSVQLEQYFGVPHCDVCMYVCIYLPLYVFVPVCAYVCMSPCTHACVKRGFSLWLHIYIYIPFERAKSLKTCIQGEKTSCRNMCVGIDMFMYVFLGKTHVLHKTPVWVQGGTLMF
jgi:hypothetical protein